MKLGIVGHEAAKFTPTTEARAREIIENYLSWQVNPEDNVDLVVSGACHLGGIDKWAIEQAAHDAIPYIEFPPAIFKWEGGYKQRNIKIAEESDKVICIVVKELPPEYDGMRFRWCYHCQTDSHIKSGGCWTARYAGKLGKPFKIIEI